MLLSFRELPAVLQALAQLPEVPELILVDGHGVAHPRGLGIAAHLGVVTDLPTIGVAKKILVGSHDAVGLKRGDRTPLMHRGRMIGTALRSNATSATPTNSGSVAIHERRHGGWCSSGIRSQAAM